MRKFEVVSEEFRKFPEANIYIPIRKTRHSAGYDFHSPFNIEIMPHSRGTIWTDVKAQMGYDEVLKIYIRSSLAIKQGLMLANNVGVIDSDYYSNPDNDGNIGICLYNPTNDIVKIESGNAVAQGIFEKYYTVQDDVINGTAKRVGGMGSTGK